MEFFNFFKKVILIVVFDVLKIMDESGLFVKIFDDILSYGKIMLYILSDDNVDFDVLSIMWFKNWNYV